VIVTGTARGNGITIDSIVLQAATYEASGFFAQSGVTLSSSGTAAGFDTASSGPLSYSWLNAGTASDYEVYCQVNSGTINGTKNSWISLGSNRTWYLYWYSSSGRITLTIRRASNQVTVATATINLANG